MADPIITVENLGKRYTLRHQQKGYTTLRETLAQKARSLVSTRDAAGPAESEAFWALKDVSFEIERGDVVGIIGRNGAGKSTLLKILSRITEPTTGRIRLRGRVASLLEVGTGFHPELTGRENIFLNGAILGMTKAEIRSKFDEIVAFAEVERFLDTPVKHYSSGMYVRLAFAVAAHLEPEILIVDEVLAVGDAQFQRKCLGKIGDVARGGRTVLFVSHNTSAIRTLCSQAILLKAGAVMCHGAAVDVIASYLTPVDGDYRQSEYRFQDRDNGQAFLSRIALVNGKEEPVGRLLAGEPFSLVLDFCNSTARTIETTAGIEFLDADGLSLFTTHSNDVSGEPLLLRPGITSIKCSVTPNPFMPGTYTVRIGLVDGTWATIDVAEPPLTIEVEAASHATLNLSLKRPGKMLIPLAWHRPNRHS